MTPFEPTLVRLWMLRLMLDEGHPRPGWHLTLRMDSDVADALGLPPDIHALATGEDDDSDLSVAQKLTKVDSTLRGFRARCETAADSGALQRSALEHNVAVLAQSFSLTSDEEAVLSFLAHVKFHVGLRELVERSEELTAAQEAKLLHPALLLPEASIAQALGSHSTLRRAGLLESERHRFGGNCISTMAEALLGDDTLTRERVGELVCPQSPAPELSLEDFEHASSAQMLIGELLLGAHLSKHRNLNILLHGRPGSGKTQMIRGIATALGLELHEVTDQDGAERVDACLQSKFLLAGNPRAVLLFDEAEDAFEGQAFLGIRHKLGRSASHRMLEETQVPMIWVMNHSHYLDEALLRRFNLVVEMPEPTPEMRRRIMRRALGDRVPEQWVEQRVHDRRITPAHVGRMAQLLTLYEHAADGRQSQGELFQKTTAPLALASRALDLNLLSTGGRKRKNHGISTGVEFDPKFVNASIDVAKVAPALCRLPHARLLLCGPPGTGKTAYVDWLSKAVGKPVVNRRASDVLGMFVGQTEKAIAAAFAQAEEESAILFFDEIDSLLRSREQAGRSWEVTQVNELLQQLEAAPGIVVCATNHLDALDEAALRRFTLVIDFEPLRAEQSMELLCRLLPDLEAHPERASFVNTLSQLPQLTPGDLVSASERQKLWGCINPTTLAQDLSSRHSRKKRRAGVGGIGFRA